MCSLDGSLGACSAAIFSREDFSNEEWYLIKLRSRINVIVKICENHRKNFLVFYESGQKKCCDPYFQKRHLIKAVDGSRSITMHMHMKSKPCSEFSTLIPGRKLCKKCYYDVSAELSKISSDSSPASSQDRFQCSGDLAQQVVQAAGSIENVIGIFDQSQDLFADEEEDIKSNKCISLFSSFFFLLRN